VATAVGWQVAAGDPITASILDPPGGLPAGVTLGARVEVPYTRAIVSYYKRAAFSAGVWSVSLDGVIDPGQYEFVWRTDDAEPPYMEVFLPLSIQSVEILDPNAAAPISFPPVDREAIRPSIDEVAALERTRTIDSGGNEKDTFDATTRPTGDEAAGLVEQAIDDVLAELPQTFDPGHYEQVERAVTFRAAMLIETSYFREEVGAATPALVYQQRADRLVAVLNERMRADYSQAATSPTGTLLA
jgi:hypothetical protein